MLSESIPSIPPGRLPLVKTIARALHTVQHLLFRPQCCLCDRPASSSLCVDCLRRLRTCEFSPDLQYDRSAGVLAWGRYGRSLKQAIAALKYGGEIALAKDLGWWLADAWQRCPQLATRLRTRRPFVVPIPVHVDKLQERGFDQAAVIAESFCTATGLPLMRHGLERLRYTQAQFGLSAVDRERNLKGAFAVSPRLKRRAGRPIVLVDDIYTTGATARSAIQALKAAGFSRVVVAAVARAVPECNPLTTTEIVTTADWVARTKLQVNPTGDRQVR